MACSQEHPHLNRGGQVQVCQTIDLEVADESRSEGPYPLEPTGERSTPSRVSMVIEF